VTLLCNGKGFEPVPFAVGNAIDSYNAFRPFYLIDLSLLCSAG
jgi:hypothetical protein